MAMVAPMGPRRLRVLNRHVAVPSDTAAAALSLMDPSILATHHQTDTMPAKLLDDEQLKLFVQRGFVSLPITELSRGFHEALDEKARVLAAPQGGSCLHNNIYPAIPELGTVMRSPTVRGALQSVLGSDYAMHACRAYHNSDGRTTDQAFHKDGLEGHGPVRHHRPRWAMIMYVPLGSSLQMGPTAILPGSQFLSSTGEDWKAVNESHPPNDNLDQIQRGLHTVLDESKAHTTTRRRDRMEDKS